MNYFITGTDTGVGKTYFTTLLTRALRKAGFDTLALKPLCCGPRDDVEAFYEAVDHEIPLDLINPVWLAAPASPFAAARHEARQVDIRALESWFLPLRASRRSLLVEGAGGWLVPLAPGVTMADLAVRLHLPVLVVVANKLGCLNHTLLTIESIRARGLTCAGLVINHLSAGDSSLASRTNSALLSEFSDVPILFDISPGQSSLHLAVA